MWNQAQIVWIAIPLASLAMESAQQTAFHVRMDSSYLRACVGTCVLLEAMQMRPQGLASLAVPAVLSALDRL